LKHIAILNDMSKPFNGGGLTDGTLAAYAQNKTAFARFGGPLATGRSIQDPSVIFWDFASDGITDVTELGSLLDTNTYAQRGLEVAFYTTMTTSATTTKLSQVLISGRRFYGDLKQFQALKLA
jgi:hypothetical protein